MRMKNPLQDSDLLLFRAAMAEVEPLRQDTVAPYRAQPPPLPRPRPAPPREPVRGLSEATLVTPEYLSYSQPGVQQRLLRELQAGRLAIGLELDLHGLTADYAQALLHEFLAACRLRRVRCARIIHGKGTRSPERQPVLKRKLNYWLRCYPEVLAFCSAPRHDGGTGALYVLLRNPVKAARADAAGADARRLLTDDPSLR